MLGKCANPIRTIAWMCARPVANRSVEIDSKMNPTPSLSSELTLVLSSPISSESWNSISDIGKVLGRANYSYSIVMTKFLACFRSAGVRCLEVASPVFYPDASSLKAGAQCVHLAFYPPEELRLLKGAKNIIAFAWEFSTLKADEAANSSHAFASQKKMLALADEIWTPSQYAARVIRSETPYQVRVIPAPITVRPGAANERIDSARRDSASPRRSAYAICNGRTGNFSALSTACFRVGVSPRGVAGGPYQSIAGGSGRALHFPDGGEPA